MPTTTSLTTTYAGKEAGGYIRAALLAAESIQHLTVKENIEYKQVVRRLTDNISFAAQTCDFTPTGTVTLNERILTLEGFQVHRQLCKKDFLTDWEAKSEQDGTLHASLSEAMIANMLEGMAQKNESLIWTGVNGNTGEYDGFLTLFDADGSVNKVSNPEALTASNIFSKIQLLIAELPTRVKRAPEKPTLYMSQNAWEAFIYANAAEGNGWYTYAGPAVNPSFMGLFNIAVCPGMSDNTMVLAQKSNLWFGTNTLSQWNEVKLLDQSNIDGSDNVNFVARFFAGVQYGFSDEIAVYAPGIS